MIDPLKYTEIKAGGRLPTPSRIALDLIGKLKRDDVALPEICRLIQTDPALTGRLLKLANSAAFARARPAAAVTPEVLMLLGLPAVRNLALVFSLVDRNRTGASQRFDHAAFWSRSLAEACAAQCLGAALRVAPAVEMFALGLIADSGRLALAGLEPVRCDAILDALGPHADPEHFAAEELAAFGFDHAELSAALLADWGLPKLFCEAARWHALPESHWPFEPDSRPWRLAAALALAHRLADAFDLDEEPRRNAAEGLAPRAAHLGIADWFATADAALAAWRDWGEALALPTAPLTPFLTLAQRPRGAPGGALRVLVVEDDTATRRLLEGVLTKDGFEVRAATDGEEGLALARSWLPEIVVTDILMPGKSGLDLIRELRASQEGRHQYIVVITILDEADKLVEAFSLGADDYVAKPIDARVLLARLLAGVRSVRLRQDLVERNMETAEALRRAEAAALTDALTGLPNRRYAMQRLKQECTAAERSDRPLSLLMIDIDRFKRINDSLGHDAGDAVLREIGRRLHETARASDVVCRFGGEEFLVVAIDTPIDAAAALAERMRRKIVEQPIDCGGRSLTLSASFGVAERSVGCEDVDRLVKAADEALYAAKAGGRNRVTVAAAQR